MRHKACYRQLISGLNQVCGVRYCGQIAEFQRYTQPVGQAENKAGGGIGEWMVAYIIRNLYSVPTKNYGIC